MYNITPSPVRAKQEEPPKLRQVLGEKVYLKNIPLDSIITVPKDAVICTLGASPRKQDRAEQYLFYQAENNQDSPWLWLHLLPIPWAKQIPSAISRVESEDQGWGQALLERCRYRWQCPRTYDGWFVVAAPNLDAYLGHPDPFEEVDHAA